MYRIETDKRNLGLVISLVISLTAVGCGPGFKSETGSTSMSMTLPSLTGLPDLKEATQSLTGSIADTRIISYTALRANLASQDAFSVAGLLDPNSLKQLIADINNLSDQQILDKVLMGLGQIKSELAANSTQGHQLAALLGVSLDDLKKQLDLLVAQLAQDPALQQQVVRAIRDLQNGPNLPNIPNVPPAQLKQEVCSNIQLVLGNAAALGLPAEFVQALTDLENSLCP